MTIPIVIVGPSSASLGPLFQFYQLAPDLTHAGYELHLACFHHDQGSPSAAPPTGIYVHSLGTGKRRSQLATLDGLLARIRPAFVHNWLGGSDVGRWLTKRGMVWIDTRLDMQWWQPRQSWWPTYRPRPLGTLCYSELPVANGDPQQLPVHRHWPNARAVRAATVNRFHFRQWAEQKWGISVARRLIVCAAPLVPATRTKDLIWALDLLHVIRDDLHLLVLGTGTQLPALQRFARATNVAPRVTFADNPPEATDVVASADVFWHAHLKQNQPDGIMWAMASGVPVVAAWGPATEQLVRHQQTALGVELGRRDQFARWTKFLLEQPDAARRMTDQARTWVASRYPVDRAARQVIELYRSVVK